jgi:hypothetical protein
MKAARLGAVSGGRRRASAPLSRARLRCGKLLVTAALLLCGKVGWAAESADAYNGALTITL